MTNAKKKNRSLPRVILCKMWQCGDEMVVFVLFQFYSKTKGILATTLQKPKVKEGIKSAALQLSKSNSHIIVL